MSEFHRGAVPSYRDYGGDSDDEHHHRGTTITRYKVKPSRGSDSHSRSTMIELDDEPRSRYSSRHPGDYLGFDRRPPDRPRSAFEPHPDYFRSSYHDPGTEAASRMESDRARITVYEEDDLDLDPSPKSHPDWDQRSRSSRQRRGRGDDVRMEKKTEERFEDEHGHQVERYRKETEYYAQPGHRPAPLVIRQQAPEPQKIIIQEEPARAPIVVSRRNPDALIMRDRESDRELIRRDRDLYYEDDDYRRQRRDVVPYRGEREYALSRRHRRMKEDYYSDDEDKHSRRAASRRQRSESPHHGRRLAEGALAGAGISALVSSRRDEHGDLPEHRGRKVLAGAALGALGTEVVQRAHSAYEERYGDGRESPDRHSTLKKGLGIAAVALAAAGAAKYYQASKIDKEEAHRGRSRTRDRHSDDGPSRSLSRTSRSRARRSRSRLGAAATAALGTVATAGIIKHIHDRSKSRSGRRSRSRSKSLLRRGAEVAGVAAVAGVAGKLWKDHKEKKEARDYSSTDDERDYHRRSRSRGISRDVGRDGSRGRGRGRHRSRSRSRNRTSPHQADADPGLGLVEYGRDPLYPESPSTPGRDRESGPEDWRPNRRHRRRRSGSSSLSDQGRDRSRSRFRDLAAAGAAAVGLKEGKGSRDHRRQEQRLRETHERDRDWDRGRESEREREAARERDWDMEERNERNRDRNKSGAGWTERGRGPEFQTPEWGRDEARAGGRAEILGGRDRMMDYDDGAMENEHLDEYDHRRQSARLATSDADYPPYPLTPGPVPGGTAHSLYQDLPHDSSHEYQPYVPQDYTGYAPPPPPPPPGPPLASGPETANNGGFIPAPPGPPTLGGSHVPDQGLNKQQIVSLRPEASTASKSVTFMPLSPQSSRTMMMHRQEHGKPTRGEQESRLVKASRASSEDEMEDLRLGDRPHRRRYSDPASDRPMIRRRRDSPDETAGDDDVEVLPDRFDAQGRPLDGRSLGRDRWTTRKGAFERRASHPGDWDVRGAWQVGSSDAEAADALARDVTSALQGQRRWLSILGDVLGSTLLPPPVARDRNQARHRYDQAI